jgi:hypothetical protein
MGYPGSTPSWQTILNPPVRRKVFLSHSHIHERENAAFLRDFGDVFIAKQLGIFGNEDFINSTDTNYVMHCVRSRYVQDSTVTIVLIGACVHSRRYIDWEIKASLRQGADSLPNGLLGITLPSTNGNAVLPERFEQNWKQWNSNCYAHFQPYPASKEQLRIWIEEAYARRRTHSHLISNSRDMWGYNRECRIHGVTH